LERKCEKRRVWGESVKRAIVKERGEEGRSERRERE
jgi:hypothetical protein